MIMRTQNVGGILTSSPQTECRVLSSEVKTIISVLHGHGHYCVLEIDITTRLIKVFDGLGFPLKTWTDHVINILRRCKMYSRYVDMFTTPVDSNDSQLQLHGPNGYDAELDYLMVVGKFLPQLNNFDCGPIACLKIMNAYGVFDKMMMQLTIPITDFGLSATIVFLSGSTNHRCCNLYSTICNRWH